MEVEFHSWLRSQQRSHPALLLGPGDDAALLRLPSGGELVVSCDMLMDGTDFVLGEVEPRQIGHKGLAVNLSDMAAMAATPLAAVISVALPRRGSWSPLDLAMAIYEGMVPLANRFNVALAGGDTNVWDESLALSVTIFGHAPPNQAWTRSGGQVGDALLVTGALGGSILGRHLNVAPRVAEALVLAERCKVHAAIDISDGLALDLSRLAAASECGAALEPHRVPIADDARRLADESPGSGSPLEHALGDGEDFELLLAVSSDDADQLVAEQPLDISLTRIGQLIDQPGLWQRDAEGGLSPLPTTGYVHR